MTAFAFSVQYAGETPFVGVTAGEDLENAHRNAVIAWGIASVVVPIQDIEATEMLRNGAFLATF